MLSYLHHSAPNTAWSSKLALPWNANLNANLGGKPRGKIRKGLLHNTICVARQSLWQLLCLKAEAAICVTTHAKVLYH